MQAQDYNNRKLPDRGRLAADRGRSSGSRRRGQGRDPYGSGWDSADRQGDPADRYSSSSRRAGEVTGRSHDPADRQGDPSRRSSSRKRGASRRKSSPQDQAPARKKKSKLWIWLLLIAILAMAVYFMLNHKAFNVKYIRVEGNAVIEADEILETLGPVHSNIFRYKPSEGEKRLQNLPGLRSVKIEKDLPNRLVVKVSEAYYIGTFRVGDQIFNLDNEGKVEAKMDLDKAGRLQPLKISGPFDQAADGRTLFTDDRCVRFLDILARTKLAEETQEVNFEKLNNIGIMYRNIYVHFGPPDDVYDKLTALTAVIKELDEKKIVPKEIILNEGKNPIVVTH